MRIGDVSIDALAAPVVVVDADDVIAGWNRACSELWGDAAPERIGRPAATLASSPDEAAAIGTAIALARTGQAAGPVECSCETSRGRRCVVWSFAPADPDAGARVVATGVDVTALRSAPLANGARVRALIEHAPIAIFLADVDGRYTDVNEAACRLLGRSRDDLLGTTVADLLPEEARPKLARARDAQLAGGIEKGEWRLRHADGSWVDVEVSANILADGRWQAFVTDIRDRKARDEERDRLLDASERDRRWLSAVLETVPLGVLLFRPDGELTFNRRAEEILGSKLTKTGGRAQYQDRILYRDGSPVPPDQLVSTRVLRDGVSVVAEEFLVQRPDGSRVPVLGSAAPIRDGHGTLLGGIGVFQDVSERMRAEESVRANERLLNAIFDPLPVGVWIADRSGRIVRVNEAGRRIWGGVRWVGPEEYGVYRGFWADTGEPIRAEDWGMARALASGEASVGELIRIEAFDGTQKTILHSAIPLRDESGASTGAIVVNEDVTALRETEDALRRAVQARDELLGIVAHDLRSPLNAMVLQLHLLRSGRADADPALAASIDLLARGAQRMDAMIQDLLEVARIDAGRLDVGDARVSPRALLEESLEGPRVLAGRASIELELVLPEELPDVRGDRARLARVIDNLVGNALKFTRRGGRVRVGAERSGAEVVFTVADQGPGIPEQDVAHLFDRFWQGYRDDRRGVGLGLAIVKGIVEAHGGRVWAESGGDEGSRFCFAIPIAVERVVGALSAAEGR